MSGKISGVTSSQPASPATGGAGQRAAAAASNPAPSGTSATDSVKITDTATYLATAEQTLSDIPVINPDRVAQTSESLAAGTYKISPERIANQLLQFERLLPADSAN